MNDGMIKCYNMDVAVDVPIEITKLKNQNNQLIKEKRQLKNALIFVGVTTGPSS